jgi:hypothetical protein
VREYRTRCAGPDCREVGTFKFATVRERDEAVGRFMRTPWRCVRHAAPETVLGPDNPTRSVVLTVRRDPATSGALFWEAPGGVVTSGFCYGPGFQAHAVDFPEGTRLTVTATVAPLDTVAVVIKSQPQVES